MVQHHGIFEVTTFSHLGMDRNMQEQFRSHPCFERTEEFCARYDGPAFENGNIAARVL
jgi:hypothetical protein